MDEIQGIISRLTAIETQLERTAVNETPLATGSFAPADATYITQTPNAVLTNEQALSALATGYMKVTTATGVITSQAAPIPIADGGTGAITALAAFNALDPLTTKGDLLGHDGTNSVRLAVGANGDILTADSTVATGFKWAANAGVTGSGSANQIAYWSSASVIAGDGGLTYNAGTDTLTAVNLTGTGLLDVNAGTARLPTNASALTTTEGHFGYESTREYVRVYNGVREIVVGAVGYMPYAYSLGEALTDSVAAGGILAISGGSVAFPVVLSGHMLLESVTVRNTDTTLTRTAEWRIYEDRLDNSNTLDEVAGANGTWSFSPGVASDRTSTAASAPVYLAPGIYWAVIRNTSASVSFGYGICSPPVFLQNANASKTKTLGSALGATLDFVAATWAGGTNVPGFRLNGRVFGETTAY